MTPVRPRKLLYVITEDFYFCSHRLPLALRAKSRGFDVQVATRVRDSGSEILAAGIRLIPFEMSRTSMNPVSDAMMLLRLCALYRRERPDVVHHVAMKPVLYGSIAARIAGVPTVVNALAGMGWLFTPGARGKQVIAGLLKAALRRVLSGTTCIVQNADDVQLVEGWVGQRASIRLIRGVGVDLTVFRPATEPTGMQVVLPARILWDKGVGEFAEAAREVHRVRPHVRFVLAGSPDVVNPSSVPESVLDRWVAEGTIAAWGWQGNMPAVFEAANIVCLPSYREGLPKALLEAAASGRAIVTTDVPGCREIVRHGIDGLLVPPRDARALAEAILTLVDDPALRRRLAESARRRAEEQFSSEQSSDATLALYGAAAS